MDSRPAPVVSFAEAVRVWVKIGLLSFGGPAGQIAVMHRILVEEKRWLSEGRFLHALHYCMLLPGPEAMQLATYSGWLLHGTRGGLVAGVLFVLPGVAAILGLSILYTRYQDVGFVMGLLFGLKAAVLAIVIEAVIRIGRRALATGLQLGIAAAAFVAMFFLNLPFPYVVGGAALVGLAAARWRPGSLPAAGPEERNSAQVRTAVAGGKAAAHVLRVLATWLPLWLGPVLALRWLLGPDHVLALEASFFSKAAVVTFGGAYAVLAYIAQQAVEVYGWLQPGEMLDGLGMAETTPGPLIMVTQFVGYMGAFRNPEPFSPLVAGLLGSLVTTWVTFVPCFLWIFLGAPWVERLRGNRWLTAALSSITAAVVGVVLNLAMWFALHVLFAEVAERRAWGLRLLVPEFTTWDPVATGIGAAAFFALFALRWDMIRVLGGAVVLGLAAHLLGARPA